MTASRRQQERQQERARLAAEQAAIAAAQVRDDELTRLRAAEFTLKRRLAVKRARKDLIDFTKLTMPDQADPSNSDLSRYHDKRFHRVLAAALEQVECGKMPRLIVTFPPRHGKSELTSRRFPAWLAGRDPYRHIMFATYNQPFAEDFGRDVRKIMREPSYAEIFPDAGLQKGEAASDRLRTEAGGMLVFVGRGGSSTGRGADFLIIDDPLKDRAEADSASTRDELWDWFNDTASTRLMSDTGAIVVIQTRWHEDDLVGRLTDPENPKCNRDEAKAWHIFNVPALAEENDVLGRAPGEALWPERFGVDYLEGFRRRNPRGFSALYQQKPAPEDGNLYTRDMFRTYKSRGEIPKQLRVYAASDHAVSTKQENDKTCILIVGVDTEGVIWLLDAWWKRAKPDVVVDAMLELIGRWKPLLWWAEGGHISKSIGPFLDKRMRETGKFCAIIQLHPAQDKQTRAQSMIGRMSLGMVKFPEFAPWFAEAQSEMLKFPSARFDDFVDAMSMVGLGLGDMAVASRARADESKFPKSGTMGWVKWAANRDKRASRATRALREG